MSANAQVVINPTVVIFTPSSDHNATTADGRAMVTGYDLEVFVAGTVQPFAVVSLGKPNPGADGRISAAFNGLFLSPLQSGVPLEARVAAVGPTGRGESAPSNLFEFSGSPSPSPSPAPTPSSPASALVSLSIVQPAARQALRLGDAVTVVVKVTGRVSGVDFYVNGRPIGTAILSPYSVKWRSQATGNYTFIAVTVDMNGRQVISSPVTVTVSRNVVGPRKPPTGAKTVGKATVRR